MPVGLVMALVAGGSLWMGWETQQRVHALEMELVKRQQGSSEQASEARVLAKQADTAVAIVQQTADEHDGRRHDREHRAAGRRRGACLRGPG